MPVFELHITIDLLPEKSNDFINHCSKHGLKPIFVGVSYTSGFKRFVQTSRYISGQYPEALLKLNSDANILTISGFKIIRKKIEAIASTIDDPFEYTQLNSDDISSSYYETHIVFGLNTQYLTDPKQPYVSEFKSNSELEEIEKINQEYYRNKAFGKYRFFVPLSFNLKKSEENQCFLTLRHYSNEFNKVSEDEQLIIQKISGDLGIQHIKTIREFVIYDTNSSVDAEIWC